MGHQPTQVQQKVIATQGPLNLFLHHFSLNWDNFCSRLFKQRGKLLLSIENLEFDCEHENSWNAAKLRSSVCCGSCDNWYISELNPSDFYISKSFNAFGSVSSLSFFTTSESRHIFTQNNSFLPKYFLETCLLTKPTTLKVRACKYIKWYLDWSPLRDFMCVA